MNYIGYKGKPIKEWYISPENFQRAEKNGIPKVTLINRIRLCGWDMERACTEPVNRKTISTLTEEQKKMLEESGMRRGTFLSRINRLGWSIEKALSTPVRRIEYDDVFSEEEKNLKNNKI